MKHKHYEMIVAKAEDMDLVVFVKREDSDWYLRANQDITAFSSDNEYFLCLPKHKDACLHWLNGGDIDWTREEEPEGCWFGKEKLHPTKPWKETSGFMLDDNIYRINHAKKSAG